MGKRVVIEGQSRNARKIRRQQLGNLKNLIVKPQTERRYKQAICKFFEFIRWNKIPLPSQLDAVDEVASMFVEELWEEGDCKYVAQDAISALQHFEPQLKRKLPRSWRLLRAWQQHEIPTRAPPFTPSTLAVLADWMQQNRPELALSSMLGFHGLLRTAELLQVRNRHIICTDDLVVVYLGVTKMAARNASTESTSFRHREVSLMLRAWKAVHPLDRHLINMPASSFRHWFASGLHATGLHTTPYKPYSLRRGGATQAFLETNSYSSVCQRGRWSSERTARINIQDSAALLTESSGSLSVKQQEFQQFWLRMLGRLEPPSSNARRGRGRGR